MLKKYVLDAVLVSEIVLGYIYWWVLRGLSSVQFSCSVVSDPLRPQGLQHARPPCPSPTPGVSSNSCPLSRWCHPTISTSVVHFSSCLQSFPASGSFQWVSSLHQVAKVLEFSFSISPSNEYSGLTSFRIDWLDLLAVHGTLKSLLQQHSSKASILWCSAFLHSPTIKLDWMDTDSIAMSLSKLQE